MNTLTTQASIAAFMLLRRLLTEILWSGCEKLIRINKDHEHDLVIAVGGYHCALIIGVVGYRVVMFD